MPGYQPSGSTTAATRPPRSYLHRVFTPKMVQELLGHSTIALTLDVYSHATPAMHEQAAVTMERALAG
jgi:integrase